MTPEDQANLANSVADSYRAWMARSDYGPRRLLSECWTECDEDSGGIWVIVAPPEDAPLPGRVHHMTCEYIPAPASSDVYSQFAHVANATHAVLWNWEARLRSGPIASYLHQLDDHMSEATQLSLASLWWDTLFNHIRENCLLGDNDFYVARHEETELTATRSGAFVETANILLAAMLNGRGRSVMGGNHRGAPLEPQPICINPAPRGLGELEMRLHYLNEAVREVERVDRAACRFAAELLGGADCAVDVEHWSDT